jgi:redox-sensitive bicupin YhaK (pirin superfamily)
MIIKSLGFPWQTSDPFLFCMYHNDRYPAGNAKLGPAASLAGRNIGQDFEGKDGWRMYHGQSVPGFPQHPHRGFETVTIVRKGFIDHSDSLGAAARFGPGDVQWLTAGRGVVHSEMFPLLHPDKPNPLELFQIWLNLPRDGKLVEPHFAMLWSDAIPKHTVRDAQGRSTEVTIVAGELDERRAPPPPPKSWAARKDSDLAIWTIRMDPHAAWTIPAARPGSTRTVYFFDGSSVTVNGQTVDDHAAIELDQGTEVPVQNGPTQSELLYLQARPINEPVVQYGPFVMNTRDEIQQAFRDYRLTGFGGWPWPTDDPVHPREDGRFARHANGLVERVG